MLHARPHLTTHNRGDGHSSVAGAAYRLGLRLYDRTNKKVFDFRKRRVGEEIVFSTTLAPAGSPEWATDPQELWNRVEAAEKRRDSQVARDYRVPLPLGLPDADVIAMAKAIANYIVQKLVTPVSVGVHRDAEVDAFGVRKSPDQIGCHAHVYFPTRAILLGGDAVRDGKAGGTGMGKKFAFLTNKSTSGLFVDDLNAFWADTANRYTEARGIPADYDHRSYRRQGLKIKPQERLGEAATALERQGIRTARGDAVRATLAMSEVYRAVHAQRHTRAGHAPATEGFFAESVGEASVAAIRLPSLSPTQDEVHPSTATMAAPAPSAGDPQWGSHAATQGFFADPAAGQPSDIRMTARRSPLADAPAPDAAQAWTGPTTAGTGPNPPASAPQNRAGQSLSERFRELYFAGVEEGDRPERTLVYRLVLAIERAFKRTWHLGQRLYVLDQELRQARTEKLDADADLDDWQRERQARHRPEPQVVAWQRAARRLGHWIGGEPREISPPPGPTDGEVEARLRTRVETRVNAVADVEAQIKTTRQAFARERRPLREAWNELRTEHEAAFPQLLAVVWQNEREWLEMNIPEWLGPVSAPHDERDDAQGRRGVQRPVLKPRLPRTGA